MRRLTKNHLGLLLALGLSLVPLATLVRMLNLYAVDIPIWDEWAMLSLFERYYAGSLGFADFWVQNNEHRLVLPKLLFLGLGVLTRYNVVYEMGCSVFLACLIWICVGLHLRANRVVFGLERSWIWLLPAAAVLVFSLRQHENWFWGFQLQWYLNVLAVTAGAYVFANRELTPRTFAALFGCGLAALFSLSSGALYWPLMLVFLLLRGPALGLRKTLCAAAAWTLLSCAVMALYLAEYQTPHYPGGFWQFLRAPLDYARYVLLYCGNILGQVQDEGWTFAWIGLAGLLAFATAFARLALAGDALRFQRASFFLILGGYAVCCALLTGVGRLSYGVWQASSSRYATMSMLLWLAVLFFGYRRLFEARRRGQTIRATLAGALCCLLVAGAAWRGATCVPYIRFASEVYSKGREALRRGGPEQALADISWDPQSLVTHAAPFFLQHRLSVFRDQPAQPETPSAQQ